MDPEGLSSKIIRSSLKSKSPMSKLSVRSMASLWWLSCAAFSASCCARVPEAHLFSSAARLSAACVGKRCMRPSCLCENRMPRRTKTANSLGVNPSVAPRLARSPPPNLTGPLVPVLAFRLLKAASSARCCATHAGTVWGRPAPSRRPFEKKPSPAYPVRLSS